MNDERTLTVTVVDVKVLSTELAPETAQASAAHASLKVLELHSQRDVDEVGATLLEVKRRFNGHDDARKKATEPLRAEEKKINDAYRPLLNFLSACEVELKRALGEFSKKEATRSAALMAQAQAHVASGAPIAAGDAIAQIASVSSVKGITTKPVWRMIVKDPELVPRKFLYVDEQRVLRYGKEHAKADGTPPEIPGIEWIEERQVIARPGAA